MNNTIIAFIISSLAGFSTLIGALIIFISKKKTLNFLIKGISFSAGIMFSLSIFFLIPESISFLNLNIKTMPSLLICFISFTLGITIFIIIDKIFPRKLKNKSLYKLSIITMVGITIHNIPEGIATFITTNENIKLGINLAFSISMHNIPEGISIALPIYYHFKNKKKVFLYTSICALSEPFGALLAYLFIKPTYLSLGIIYGLIAGIMSYISIYELIPSVTKYKRYKIILIFYLVGTIFILINKLLT